MADGDNRGLHCSSNILFDCYSLSFLLPYNLLAKVLIHCFSNSLFFCVQFQCPAAAHHSHFGVWCVCSSHIAGHRASGTAQYPFLSGPNAVRLVHHAVQSQSRLHQHTALHPGSRLSTVSTVAVGWG